MADVKISGLPASTTPLAGTEVLPIVQGGTTKQVSVNNLTAGKAVSALSVTATNLKTSPTTANLDISGSTIAATGTDVDINISLTPKGTGDINLPKVNIDGGAIDGTPIGGSSASTGNFTTASASRVNVNTGADALSLYIKGRASDNVSSIYFNNNADSAQYGNIVSSASEILLQSIGNRPLSLGANGTTHFQVNATGNLVVVGSGKGIDFSATAGTGTSELLADYEEGTFTPTWTAATGSGQNVNNAYGYYTKVGNCVFITIYLGTNGHGTAAGTVTIGGLPFSPAASGFQKGGFYCVSASASGLGIGQVPAGAMNYAAASFTPIAWGVAGGGFAAMSAADWGVSGEYFFAGSYQTT
jgi:hypothetical protein